MSKPVNPIWPSTLYPLLLLSHAGHPQGASH
jgi:hypothetical protein